MTRRPALVIALLTAAAETTVAQHVRLGVSAVALTHVEVHEGERAAGEGVGGSLELRRPPLSLEVTGILAFLDRDDPAGTSFDLRQLDVRARYAVTPLLALEAGAGRRAIEPRFAAQEVGLVRFGIYAPTQLTRTATVWARAAYLPVTRFTGGGSADLALEFGLGMGLESGNGRLRLSAEFEFQRIDREVDGVNVPIQVSVARLGAALGLF